MPLSSLKFFENLKKSLLKWLVDKPIVAKKEFRNSFIR